MDWINPVATLVAVVLGGAIATWQAKRERRTHRINAAVGAYRDFLDRRIKAIRALEELAFIQEHAAAAAIPRAMEKATNAVEAVGAALWVVMTSDSVGVRSTLAVNVHQCLAEMGDDLAIKDHAKFEKHRAQERIAYNGLAEGLDFLNRMLPGLPVSKDLEKRAASIRAEQLRILPDPPKEGPMQ